MNMLIDHIAILRANDYFANAFKLIIDEAT